MTTQQEAAIREAAKALYLKQSQWDAMQSVNMNGKLEEQVKFFQDLHVLEVEIDELKMNLSNVKRLL